MYLNRSRNDPANRAVLFSLAARSGASAGQVSGCRVVPRRLDRRGVTCLLGLHHPAHSRFALVSLMQDGRRRSSCAAPPARLGNGADYCADRIGQRRGSRDSSGGDNKPESIARREAFGFTPWPITRPPIFGWLRRARRIPLSTAFPKFLGNQPKACPKTGPLICTRMTPIASRAGHSGTPCVKPAANTDGVVDPPLTTGEYRTVVARRTAI